MTAKHVALLALLTVGSACAVYAQPPDDAPPPDQYQAPDQYQGPDAYAPQPVDNYAYQPPDQYGAPPDYQGGAVDIGFFYDQLSPYGHWVESRSYGWVWLPFGLRVSWRPYAYGHWVMTDYGWTWVSDEPFGWATYHYGRWVFDPDYGWEWVPGYEWGPAWVAWRTGGGYIGWAPLPPEVRFRAGFGLDFGGFDLEVGLGATHFCFVEERAFLAPNVVTYVQPPARNVTIIHNTTNITNYTVVNNRVVNQGIPVQHVEQVTGQRVQRLQVATVTSGPAPRTSQVRGNQLTVFQPTIVKRATPPPPPPVRARATGTDLQRQHQQETQALQAQQAQERSRLQQIHQRELQGGASQGGTAPSSPRQVQTDQQRRQDQRQQQQQQPQQQDQRQQRQQDQRQQQAEQQRQGTPQRAAPNSQDLAQRHQAEIQAQQQQHQREQQQLEARHRAEQQATQRQPPPGQQRRGDQQQQQNKKNEPKRPEGPPPTRRR